MGIKCGGVEERLVEGGDRIMETFILVFEISNRYKSLRIFNSQLWHTI